MTETAAQRIDKWLWHARFFKTRGLATKLVSAGHLRIDGDRVSKPSFGLRVGATLTFPQARRIRVVRVEHLSTRRGPAAEARTLYTDLTPPEDPVLKNPRYEGKGRPSGKDRRNARLSGPPTLE
ncbi:MAG: RNA-binding S4 domain-containing protein [Boseongicola sp.]|nr:MAG: RNA-binding S4 domain-containing protein [Boseongicola sp.]